MILSLIALICFVINLQNVTFPSFFCTLFFKFVQCLWFWEGITHLSKIEDWKRFEKKHNPAIALNALYIKGKEICTTSISNFNSNCEKKKFF